MKNPPQLSVWTSQISLFLRKICEAGLLPPVVAGGSGGLLLSGEDVLMQIWDTTGQEAFKSMNKLYFKGVHGIVLVCDLAEQESL